MSSDLESMKYQFAAQLKKCLELHYCGRIPSISTIARDFSLKANHLPHVSGETVRKWLRAETIPQYPRVQSLADWLGPELLFPFENWRPNNEQSHNGHNHNGQKTRSDEIVITPDEAMHFMLMIQKLHRDDFALIHTLATKLYAKRGADA
jgi:hypothetical protein